MPQKKYVNKRPAASCKIDIESRDRLSKWIEARKLRTNHQDVVTRLVDMLLDLDDETATAALLGTVTPEDRAAVARLFMERVSRMETTGPSEAELLERAERIARETRAQERQHKPPRRGSKSA